MSRNKNNGVYCFVSLVFTISFVQTTCSTPDVQGAEYWYKEARLALQKRLQSALGLGLGVQLPHAKNVVYFVGDGMSLATLTAARLLRGQRQGKKGEEHELAWDIFPAVALAKTYNADSQIGESSACATALMCGVKANFETIGLDARGSFENCFSSLQSRVSSLADWAQESGKSVGIVTNTRITHATPAALYGHSASRYWEDDSRVPSNVRRSCKDLTRQLVENDPGRNINVLLGGGRRHWLPKVAKDPEAPYEDGRRLDGRNLIDDWLRDKKKRGLRAKYVWNKDQMDKIVPNEVDYLLGLFGYSHLDFEADRETFAAGDPSLADMTRTALQILRKNPEGFFLFVEGGRIDHAHHFNNAHRALDETLSMETALLAAMDVLDTRDTLFVVTADHSHVMTLGGHATPRGHPVLGTDSRVSDVDGQPYTTLLYGNGPGYSSPRPIPLNISTILEDKNAVHGSAVPRKWGTHGGEDVPVYALGPLATVLFSGTVDQTYIPHAIAFIACLGPHIDFCRENITARNNEQLQNTHCTEPNARVDLDNIPIVIASSVMIDDSDRTRTHLNKVAFTHPKYLPIVVQIVIVYLFTI